MSSTLLTEYRCPCGKLLFKGLLFQCVVEVKCRRCGEVMSWGPSETPAYAFIQTDAHERVVDVSHNTSAVLGCDRDYFIGKQLEEVFPLIRDKINEGALPLASGKPYDIGHNVLMLRDGKQAPVESCVVSRSKNGAPAGYCIFTAPTRRQNV